VSGFFFELVCCRSTCWYCSLAFALTLPDFLFLFLSSSLPLSLSLSLSLSLARVCSLFPRSFAPSSVVGCVGNGRCTLFTDCGSRCNVAFLGGAAQCSDIHPDCETTIYACQSLVGADACGACAGLNETTCGDAPQCAYDTGCTGITCDCTALPSGTDCVTFDWCVSPGEWVSTRIWFSCSLRPVGRVFFFALNSHCWCCLWCCFVSVVFCFFGRFLLLQFDGCC
jgi:hypothetical protein